MDIYGFHEASVLELRRDGSDVLIRLDVDFCDLPKRRKVIVIHGVDRIEIDSQPAEDLTCEEESSELLEFEINEDHVFLLIEWTNFSSRTNITRAYRIYAKSAVF
ncbi:hypothetical protein [Roseibium suaedae]|uniref:hypothetical protein n=1 Tax=Roseibium suaedae TaxID=735517 RepID=UPI001114CE93|nr:hypothetical protein [Roseibium suaedae]